MNKRPIKTLTIIIGDDEKHINHMIKKCYLNTWVLRFLLNMPKE